MTALLTPGRLYVLLIRFSALPKSTSRLRIFQTATSPKERPAPRIVVMTIQAGLELLVYMMAVATTAKANAIAPNPVHQDGRVRVAP